MKYLLCWNCSRDTNIEATDDEQEALCPHCEQAMLEADDSQYMEPEELQCSHDFIAQTAGGREYCPDCGIIFQ